MKHLSFFLHYGPIAKEGTILFQELRPIAEYKYY